MSKPAIIGIYGLPGSGKSYLLNQLKEKLANDSFEFVEGSEVIAAVVPDGLAHFQSLPENDKLHYRQTAIDTIRNNSAKTGRTAVVVGHFMFWSEEDAVGKSVMTDRDRATYTHILYLNERPKEIEARRHRDVQRRRAEVSVDHLTRWEETEKTELRRICRENGILFSLLEAAAFPELVAKATALLRDFHLHSETYNLTCVQKRLSEADDLVQSRQEPLETMLVLDADRTLAAEDAGNLFWSMLAREYPQAMPSSDPRPLKTLFGSKLGYSYTAFRQAMLMYEEATSETVYEAVCADVARAITMYPAMVSFLREMQQHKHVGAVVITCGLRRVWELVLEREGLTTVPIIGSGRLTDGYVVNPEVKASLVSRLRNHHGLRVFAFGDSPMDLPMFQAANEAFVIVGEAGTRSKTVDAALLHAIDKEGLKARQVLLPSSVPPRLDTTRLPVLQLTDITLVDAILQRRPREADILAPTTTTNSSNDMSPTIASRVLHATDRPAAKLLMTPTRDARISGPALRDAHRHVGRYLATELVSATLGLETVTIPHVQGYDTTGHRLQHEAQTVIVALMRAGEPLATGISDIFPLARFIHARNTEDLQAHHLRGLRQVLLVDAVVNNGETIVKFARRVRELDSSIHIVIVATVVQAKALSKDGAVAKVMENDKGLSSVVALRLSDNKFKGKGGTDTGHRLFNTTYLD